MNPTLKKILPLVIIVFGNFVLMGMAALKPEPKKVVKKPNIPLVESKSLVKQNAQITIASTGIVKSISEINLVPEVAGRIIFKSKKMINGGFFKKGEILYRIDPTDYQLQLNASKAEVAIQEVNNNREKEEQQIAEDEWKIYSEANPNQIATDLTLRKPQLAMAQANLEAAKARMAIAEKNLSRTTIYAPYSGSVKMKMVDVGQYVAPGTPLAQIFNSEKAQITVSIDPGKSSFIQIGNSATISESGMSHVWNGKVVSVGGSLDSQSRLVNVTIEVDNPYEYQKPLLNGLFVHVDIKGKQIENVFTIPLSSLREKEYVWLLTPENTLKIEQVSLVHIQNSMAILDADLGKNSQLITSMISNAEDGMNLRNE